MPYVVGMCTTGLLFSYCMHCLLALPWPTCILAAYHLCPYMKLYRCACTTVILVHVLLQLEAWLDGQGSHPMLKRTAPLVQLCRGGGERLHTSSPT